MVQIDVCDSGIKLSSITLEPIVDEMASTSWFMKGFPYS